MNNPELVNKETPSRIWEAVEALDYQANPATRALASCRWNTIGVVVPSLDQIMFQHQLWLLEAEIAERDISLLISATNHDEVAEVIAVRGLVTRGVDVTLLTHVDRPGETLRILDIAKMPRVLVGSPGRDRINSWAGYDNRVAMHSVVDHLLDIGHRRIGMLGDKPAVLNGRLRVESVAERLREAGLGLGDGHLEWAGPDEAEARAAFMRIMSRPKPPTAVACGSDDLALAAPTAEIEAGLSIPGAAT